MGSIISGISAWPSEAQAFVPDKRVQAGNLNVVNSLIRHINSLFRAEISLFYFLGNLDCKLL